MILCSFELSHCFHSYHTLKFDGQGKRNICSSSNKVIKVINTGLLLVVSLCMCKVIFSYTQYNLYQFYIE